ncbi:MAG: T9SS type A sorting domain-containing protein [candidate division Zixibacteria bacterium]
MLSKDDSVTIKIMNVKGEEATKPISGFYKAGHHSIMPKLDDVPSGVYFYRITTSDTSTTGKMVLLK